MLFAYRQGQSQYRNGIEKGQCIPDYTPLFLMLMSLVY